MGTQIFCNSVGVPLVGTQIFCNSVGEPLVGTQIDVLRVATYTRVKRDFEGMLLQVM